ncbi:secreted protein [Burkholderia pseudomallei]|nr:secreted protein [Burkholderia pseudomallei]CAJ8050465.1 secreted protein [Burkholderia pseudomallei]
MNLFRLKADGRRFCAICGIVRRWTLALTLFAGTSVLVPCVAHGDDWGCQVLLCLSNPGGPEQYGACVPPIERLWSALRHGDPFPTCDFGAGGSHGTSLTNTFASGAYCREDLLYWGGTEQSELLCRATGAINVEIDNQLYTRVWWDVAGAGSTVTEFYGAGSTQGPSHIPYDPTQSAALFLQQSEQQGGQSGQRGQSGGGH